MKSRIVGKIKTWLRAENLNEKVKQTAQTKDADGMPAFFCVTFYTVRGRISTIKLLIRKLRAYITLLFRLGSGHATGSTLKRKMFDIFRRPHPVNHFQ